MSAGLVTVRLEPQQLMGTPTMDLQQSPRRLAVGVNEACAMVGWGRSTMYDLLREGTIPSFTVGRRRMIRVTDLELYLSEQVGT